MCDQFIKGARETGHEAEKVLAKDKKINYCKGCGVRYNCKKSCPQKDDMAEILEKMISADVILFVLLTKDS